MDEKALIARAAAGDPAAERSLYDGHVDRVYRLIHRMTGCPDLAEEYTQEAFVRAFGRLAQFRGEAAFSSWLHTIAVSVTMNGLRKLKRRRLHEVSLEPEIAEEWSAKPPRLDLRRRLHAAIDALPERGRWVFVMHDIEGYRHREIAAALGIPENTSKARLFHARRALRRALGLGDAAAASPPQAMPRPEGVRHEG